MGPPCRLITLGDAQKKAKRAGMPIANIKLVMLASRAVLAAQHFPRKVDNWESLPMTGCTWAVWKMAFCLTHLKLQQQADLGLGGRGGGESLWWGSWGVSGSATNDWLIGDSA